MMHKKGIETLVGLFVLLGMLGLVFLAVKAANLGQVGGGDTYTLHARFDNIGGLKVRAPVRTAGVVVGRVTDIELDGKTYQGVVTMELARKYQFPKDSSAKILTAGLLGDQYVSMEAGGEDSNLAPDETLAQTQSAVVLENLIGQFISGKGDATEAAPSTPALTRPRSHGSTSTSTRRRASGASAGTRVPPNAGAPSRAARNACARPMRASVSS